MISFLQQENMQLKVNQILSRKPKADLVAEDDKGKVVVDVDQLEDKDVQMKPRRPKTRGLAIPKEQGSEPFSPLGQQDIDDTIAVEIEKDKRILAWQNQ